MQLMFLNCYNKIMNKFFFLFNVTAQLIFVVVLKIISKTEKRQKKDNLIYSRNNYH